VDWYRKKLCCIWSQRDKWSRGRLMNALLHCAISGMFTFAAFQTWMKHFCCLNATIRLPLSYSFRSWFTCSELSDQKPRWYNYCSAGKWAMFQERTKLIGWITVGLFLVAYQNLTGRGFWLFIFLHQASQLSVYQSHDYHVYIPYTYQSRPVSCSKGA